MKQEKSMELIQRIAKNESINFWVTNRIPRVLLTHCIGYLSQIRNRTFTRLGIALWKIFTPLDLSEAEQSEFESLHDCFTRRLKPGSRPIDSDVSSFVSPSDGIVGAMGRVEKNTLLQAKGMSYELSDLLGSATLAQAYEGGTYITIRLTSAMYHRFHAPRALSIHGVNYISGDVWNVNPAALQRIPRLFCKNERAVIECSDETTQAKFLMIPVAAVLVASLRLHFIDVLLHLNYKGPKRIDCEHKAAKGEELGWFQHGSTIILLLPKSVETLPFLQTGSQLKMGMAIATLPT